MDSLAVKSELELLKLWANVIRALSDKGIVRTNNNPIGDVTEWLVCERLGFEMAANRSQKGYDATDDEGNRYQIKGRREESSSVIFGSLRGYEERDFDYLILVVFNYDFQVTWAVKVPYELVLLISNWNKRIGSWIPTRNQKTMATKGIEDISRKVYLL